MTLRLNGSTSGYTEIDAPAVAGSNTLVLPTGNGSSGQVLSTNGSGALSWAAPGKILQVLSTAKTDTFSETLAANTNSSTNCIQVTITPATTSSKILVMVTLHGSSSYWGGVGSGAWQGRIVRNGTDIVKGDAAGSRNRVTMVTGDSDSSSIPEPLVFTYLDSPSSTSALTYGVRLDNADNGSQTLYLNRAPTDTDSNVISIRAASTITVMEVAN